MVNNTINNSVKTLCSSGSLIRCNMMVIVEHKSTCIVKSSINNSDVVLPPTVFVHNGLGNEVVGVVVCLPWM